jgi:hypothetical protein
VAGQHLSGDVTGTVTVGRYVVVVGAPAGVRLTLALPANRTAGRPVADALARQEAADSPRGPAAELSDGVEDASRVTDAAEKAIHLFSALAEGKVLEPELLEAEVHAVLGLLKRVDREGRHEDAIRLARAVSALLILMLRWVDLVDSLDLALRAAKEALDSPALAWAYHELGSLKLCADEVHGAVDFLGQARDIRERSGDERVLCVTEHNLVLALERLRMIERYGLIRRRTVVVGGATLFIGGAIGLASALGNEKTASATTPPPTTPPHTTPPHTTPPHTTPPATTTTTTTTTTTPATTPTTTTTTTTTTSTTSTTTTTTTTTTPANTA